jgi:2-oxoisovalerate dehydrogenase E2 component (dihydrolipoyl transacylase)
MSEYVFKLPDLGEGTVESEVGEWFIKVGDLVNEEDVVATMMTDKAAVELSSPVTGKVVKLAGEPGDIVAVGGALVVFDVEGGNGAAEPAVAPVTSEPEQPSEQKADEDPVEPQPTADVTDMPAPANSAPGEPSTRGRVLTSPAIRRRAKEAGIDLTIVPGTGPGGRIKRSDFDYYLERTVGQSTTTLPQRATGKKEIKVIGVRRMIAERMAAAKREIPHFSYVEEIDITELERLRKHLNGKAADPAERLTILPFLGAALIRALKDFPQCNATYDKDRNVIVQHEAVHLGVATQTPDGLKVPVVRHAEALDLHGLAAAIRSTSAAARDNKATRDQLSGSTITITSLGRLGGIVSTPVINMPEVGIIGVNRAVDRPMVVDGQVTVRTMMNLSTSFDHRFVDGYDAAAMVQLIKELLEHPATIFLP